MTEPTTETGPSAAERAIRVAFGVILSDYTINDTEEREVMEECETSIAALKAEAVTTALTALRADWEEAKQTKWSTMHDVGAMATVVNALIQDAIDKALGR